MKIIDNIKKEQKRRANQRKFEEILDKAVARRQTESLGIKLDVEGWAYVHELIVAMQDVENVYGDMIMLERAVAADKRYVLNEDRSKVRAL